MKEVAKPVEDEGIVEDDSTPGMSLTRKKALGVGAAALGGAALGGLAGAGRAEAATKATVPDGAVFRQVLTRMAHDKSFRTATLNNPAALPKAYPGLTMLQLEALRNCAILSGANIASINKVRAGVISNPGSVNEAGAIVVLGTSGSPAHSVGWTISCTCCCCCCCGETAVLVRP